MEQNIIQAIQEFARTPFLDTLLKGITQLGDEMLFLVVALTIFWCIDKRYAFKLVNIYLLGACVVEGMKNAVRRPRPYTQDGIVSVGEKTHGYSFPSGHSHSISNLCTQVSMKLRSGYVYGLSAIIVVLVAFSRMYLGQHYLTDVVTGIALGVAIAVLLSQVYELLGNHEEYIVLAVAPICLLVLLIIVILGKTEQMESIFKVLGGYTALTMGYYLEKKYVKSCVKTKWYLNIIKLVLGFGISLGLKEGLKFIFPSSIPLLYSFLRYFILGITAMVLVPIMFCALRLSKREQ